MTPARAAPDAPHAEAFVELEGATVTYGRGPRGVHALAETNLRVGQGDFVALVGPSGCGKSTILKLVTGLIKASSGFVFVSILCCTVGARSRSTGAMVKDGSIIAPDRWKGRRAQ